MLSERLTDSDKHLLALAAAEASWRLNVTLWRLRAYHDAKHVLIVHSTFHLSM